MSSKNPGIDQDSMDDNLESQKAEKEKQERIEEKFLIFQKDGWKLSGAFGDMKKDLWGVPFLMYELYKEGMTPAVESALREKAKILGKGVDKTLYEYAA